eukprot:15295749-Alexandrium_andersonii.AAC.1
MMTHLFPNPELDATGGAGCGNPLQPGGATHRDLVGFVQVHLEGRGRRELQVGLAMALMKPHG